MRATVQDNSRERRIIQIYNLLEGKSRIGVDAYDDIGNEYELKSTTKSGISTARDLGHDHLEKWKLRYWIIQFGQNTDTGFIHSATYFLAPEHMQEWYDKIEEKLNRDVELGRKIMEALGDNLTVEELDRAAYLLHRGKLLNDPNIPGSYIRKNGILIEDCPNMLRDLVQQYPIRKGL